MHGHGHHARPEFGHRTCESSHLHVSHTLNFGCPLIIYQPHVVLVREACDCWHTQQSKCVDHSKIAISLHCRSPIASPALKPSMQSTARPMYRERWPIQWNYCHGDHQHAMPTSRCHPTTNEIMGSSEVVEKRSSFQRRNCFVRGENIPEQIASSLCNNSLPSFSKMCGNGRCKGAVKALSSGV